MIRVMLVDDHILIRRGTRALLGEATDVEIVAETGQATETLVLARRVRPDVILLDIRMQKPDGIEIARTLRRELPEIKVVVLTSYDLDVYVRACFAIGVHGYLLKTASDTELIEAIRAVCRGEQALSTEIAAQLTAEHQSGIAATRALSPRERDVLVLVATGLSNREIGQHLKLKETTIESYLSAIMGKLGARSRTEAVALAVRHGIIVLEQ